MSNNLHSIMYYENNVQSPIRTYRVIAIHEHQAIFQLLDLCSTNQIPFCHIRLRSTRCHFQVNNLLFLTYSKCITQPHWKKIHMEPNATDSEFATQFSHALTFSTNKIRFGFKFDLTHRLLISCKQPAFYHVFHTGDKVQIGNN